MEKPASLANFTGYDLPNYDFSAGGIAMYNSTPSQQSFALPAITYTPPVVEFQSVQSAVQTVASVPKKTISFTVFDTEGETLPAPNIAIDGTRFIIGDENGNVVIPNVSATSTIKITYQGKIFYQSLISQLPSKIVLKEDVTMLDGVELVNKYKKPSNNWAWWLLGVLGAGLIIKNAKSGTKIVHAKL